MPPIPCGNQACIRWSCIDRLSRQGKSESAFRYSSWLILNPCQGQSMFNRIVEPQYREIRRHVLAQISLGKLTEDSELSKVLDSLECVELTMEAEESGVEPAIEIKSVRDFLWLCRAMDFRRRRIGRPEA